MRIKSSYVFYIFLTISFYADADAYDPNDWSIYVMSLSSKATPIKSETRDGFYSVYEPTLARGGWLRVSAQTNANDVDFDIAVSQFDSTERLEIEDFPTKCEVSEGAKLCSNHIWVSPGAALIRISFNWPKGATVAPTNITYQISRNSVLNLENKKRYDSIFFTLKQNYYLTHNTDWEKIYQAGAKVLTAPASLDPVPRAIWEGVTLLPGNKGTRIAWVEQERPPGAKLNSVAQANSAASKTGPDPYPSCVQIDASSWRLDLPSTSTKVGNKWLYRNTQTYIARAHECLSRPQVARWVINLTDQKNGVLETVLAALAPVFGPGPINYFKDSQEKITLQSITSICLMRDNICNISWDNRCTLLKGKIDVVINDQCGDQICGDIAIALKGHGRLLGKNSSTDPTLNDIVYLNDEISLSYTAYRITDAQGTPITSIQVDGLLDAKGIERVLTGDLR